MRCGVGAVVVRTCAIIVRVSNPWIVCAGNVFEEVNLKEVELTWFVTLFLSTLNFAVVSVSAYPHIIVSTT